MKSLFISATLLLFLSLTGFSQTKPEPCDEANYEVEGIFANSSSTAPVVKNVESTGISIGDKGELSKYFEESLFGGTVNGWIVIGTAQVTAVKGSEITFKVLEKKSQVTINGQEKSHFVAGKIIKFSQYNYKTPTKKTYYWDDGKKIKAEGNKICSNKVGLWSYYYQNGSLSGTETYDDNGLLNGPFSDYYESGKIKEKGNAKGDHTDGPFEKYFENGQVELKGGFKEDKKHGIFQAFYASGKKYYETEFNSDIRIGAYNEWSENGHPIESGSFNNSGQKHGIWKFYNANGSIEREGNVSNDVEDGVWKYYDENGVLTHESTYKNGEVTGPYKGYYPSGKILNEGMLVDNNEVGEWKTYFENGQLKAQDNYNAGIFVGPYKVWYENGQLKQEGTYNEAGKVDGPIVMFYENGKPLAKGQYLNGNKTGKWFEWDEKGKKKVVKY